MAKSEEVNYKKDFCLKYFDTGTWDLDVLKQVDVLLKDKKDNYLLYIESKYIIKNEMEHHAALAQAVLTNKKQDEPLEKVAIIYQDTQKNDVLELIECDLDSIMYNNDINWKAEKASTPTKDAIDRINDRIKGKITVYINEEIKEFYSLLKKGSDTKIQITEKNVNVVYNKWKNNVLFKEEIKDEQDLINLFLVDLLNGTKYKKSVFSDIIENNLFSSVKIGEREDDSDEDLIREGTSLNRYELKFDRDENLDGIKYDGGATSFYYTVLNKEEHKQFWKKYERPPAKNIFLKILERSSMLYSDKYRRDTGGEYTPSCFVEKQNEILAKFYNLDEFIVCDPCAGVGNLENQFGKEYKQYCYLSTLEQMDVDTCYIKGFENAMQYDFLANNDMPKWKYKGEELDINEIAKREGRKLMVIMNPPYQNKKGFKNNLAIEFFNKVLKWQPEVIVFYYATKSFFCSEIEHYIKSNYKIRSHIFSNAKTTFLLNNWAISQIIFDKNKGDKITNNSIKTERYEIEKDDFISKGFYSYNNAKPNLFKELQTIIKNNNHGLILGNVSYLNDVIKIGNGGNDRGNNITTGNIEYCLLSKGLIFNTDHKYFELNSIVYKGLAKEIPTELYNDAIMFSMFYIGFLFSNKIEGKKNYIMPFRAEELGCRKNDLNVLYETQKTLETQDEPAEEFDFREFLSQFEFSKEAKDLYSAALEIFKFYHRTDEYCNKDWNDSFYDITNTIMGKDASSFQEFETDNDTRITRTKTTKGTKGFGRNTIKQVIASKDLPIFIHFFDVRDVLAKKINKQLVEAGLLLWERENIY